MSKRTRTSKIEKWIKEGRGSGIGSDYKPWLNIQDVSSLGRSTRLKGIKIGRQHEFLSDLERNYFYLTEFSDSVVDIREQYPLLPLEETLVIADELGIKHPTDPKTNEPIVMTTDFLLTVDKGEGRVELARTIKMKDELLKEREWIVQGTNNQDISRSFIVNFNNKSYTLPLIEVVRSMLAPNRFLLYRLFEMNSFPQYFIENYTEGQIHLSFSSQYNLKYTKKSFLYQLVWLLGNRNLRRTFENIAYTFLNTGELNFDWLFQQPISIKAIVKITSNGGTILRVTEVKDKEIPFDVISFSHPEVSKYEKSNEPKKYTMHELKSSTEEKEKMIDETVEGTTEDFELIEMNKQVHKYAELPSIVKIQGKSTKQRTYEDESTKRYTFKDSGIRSASDTGGNRLARGIENQSLQQVQAEGELGEFVHVLQVLEDYKEVQFINVQLSSLPMGDGNRVFSYLEDGITPRRYALATVNLFNGNEFKILEVER